MKDLPSFEDHFPTWYDMKQEELGVMTVEVKDIIGGNPFVSQNYLEDWSGKNIEMDSRYLRAFTSVLCSKKEAKGEVVDLGRIHLLRFFSEKSKKHVYYVCNDGHRRVSSAWQLKIVKIKAEVTDVINNKIKKIEGDLKCQNG